MSVETLQILDFVKRLSFSEKLEIIELIFKNIKEDNIHIENKTAQRKAAATLLLADYQQDDELTAFTALDHEDLYEKNWNLDD